VITLSNIHYRYSNAIGPWVLKGIDLTIKEGDYVLLCGGSGSGKSTFGFLLNGLIPHFFGGVLEGTVSVCGQDTRDLTVADLLSTVGLVFQNAEAQLFNSTVENEIAFGLESMGLSAREIEKRIADTAKELNLEYLLDRSPTSLSGGEKRLVAVASVLCLGPPIIVLDEPLAHLDWEAADKVREALRDLHRKGKTLVVIEQRMNGVLDDASRCVVLGDGEILFDGMPESARPVLEQQHLFPHYPPQTITTKTSYEALLQVKNVSHWIDKKPVLKDVSLEIEECEILAIVGKNGAGKTTLIKHLNGLLRPGKGIVQYQGKDIRARTPSEMATGVGICFQNANDQFFKNTVRDELLVGLRSAAAKADQWLEELCSLFHLHDLLERSPYRLSEGQKKRVAIASVLVMQPRLLVLDEPTVGQDGHFLETMARLLVSLRQKGLTIVVVTHDLEFARTVTQRVVVLDGGKVVGIARPGTPEENAILARVGVPDVEEHKGMRGVA